MVQLQRESHTVLKYMKGEQIIKQGDYGISIYKILSGEVQVFRRSEEVLIPLATLGPGAILGEMGFLSKEMEVRSASAAAIKDTEVPQDPVEPVNARLLAVNGDPLDLDLVRRDASADGAVIPVHLISAHGPVRAPLFPRFVLRAKITGGVVKKKIIQQGFYAGMALQIPGLTGRRSSRKYMYEENRCQ